MKKIEAIIRPESVDVVRNALSEAGVTGLMISEIEGHGKQKGVIQQWRGEKYKVELLPKAKIEIIVKDQDVGRISKAIIDNAQTGEIGDGKIFIYPVDDAIRIRTGEKGEGAV
ncbi:MAG: P-II family nitrogen regulator [Candidatus Omnitrophica bacterium]|jgi:nitrogen regulatory protein P-II 1|nr:P-II family nitrogen regulator [Candidatus Omnitrophota bacterium]MDD5661497.1 P-II family nitrogen regulator [Candidatus Omnitrophota bacterium]